MAAITSAQSGNWSSTPTWTGGVVPVEGDTATVASGHTVTVDQNIVIGADSGTALTINGVLDVPYNIAADYSLTLKGNIGFGSGGEFKIGSSSNRLDNARTYTININYSASLAQDKYSFTVPNNGILSWFGSTKTLDTYLTANALATGSNSVISVNDVTNWRNGDKVILTDEFNLSSQQEYTISSISGNNVTLNTNIGSSAQACTISTSTDRITKTSHGLSSGDIVTFSADSLPTILTGTLAANTAYYVVWYDANSFYITTTLGGANIDFTSTGTNVSYYLGSRAANVKVINISNNIVIKSYSSSNKGRMILSGTGTNQHTLSYVSLESLGYDNTGGQALSCGASTLSATNDNIITIYYGHVTTGGSNKVKKLIIFKVNGGSSYINLAFTDVDTYYFISNNSANVGLGSNADSDTIRIKNAYVYASAVLGSSSFINKVTIDNLYMYKAAMFKATNSAGNIWINNCTVKNANGLNATYGSIKCKNLTSINNNPDMAGLHNNLIVENHTTDTSNWFGTTNGEVKVTNFNGTVGYNKTYKYGCTFESDSNIFRTSAPSIKVIINATKVPFTLSGNARTFYVNNNKTITLNCYVLKDILSTGQAATIRIAVGTDGHGLTETDSTTIFKEYDILPSTSATKVVTFNTTTDKVSLVAHGLTNGTKVYFGGGTLPTELSTATTYYVVNAETDYFQVESSVGGGAILLSGSTSGTTYVNTWESKSINLGTTTSAGFVSLEVVVSKGASLWNLWIDDLTITESAP